MSVSATVKKPSTLILILLAGLPSGTAVFIGPALPGLVNDFHVSPGYSQLLMSVFLLGYTFGQLIYGPLCNRFGRIPSLLFALILSLFSIGVCLLALPFHDFTFLLIGRFLSAVGTCGGLVICYTIISDYYPPSQTSKVFAMMTIAFAIFPALGTLVGGLLVEYISWQSCFYAVLMYTLIVLGLIFLLPETSKSKDHHALKLSKLLKNYGSMLTHKTLMLHAVIYGISTACIYIFIAEGPFVGINAIGLSPGEYGLLLMLPYTFSFAGSLAARHIDKILSQRRILFFGWILEIAAALCLLLFFITGQITVLTFIIPMCGFMFAHPIVLTHSTSIAMASVTDRSNASAVFSAVFMFPAFVATGILNILPTHAPIVLPLLFLVSLVIYGTCYYVAHGKKPHVA
jgi:MFS family permease